MDLGKLDRNNFLTDTQPQWFELQPRKWNEHVGGEILVQLNRTGKKIPVVIPTRSRKCDIFDLELSKSEAELILPSLDLIKYSKIKAMHNTGVELFQEIKFQTADLEDGSPRPKKKKK